MSTNYRIYHNPRCSKSRKALQILTEHHIDPQIIDYQKSPLTSSELDKLLRMLKFEPRDLMRKNEQEYTSLKLADESLPREELINAMIQHPKLIERPIIVKGTTAILGRPPEKVIELL